MCASTKYCECTNFTTIVLCVSYDCAARALWLCYACIIYYDCAIIVFLFLARPHHKSHKESRMRFSAAALRTPMSQWVCFRRPRQKPSGRQKPIFRRACNTKGNVMIFKRNVMVFKENVLIFEQIVHSCVPRNGLKIVFAPARLCAGTRRKYCTYYIIIRNVCRQHILIKARG